MPDPLADQREGSAVTSSVLQHGTQGHSAHALTAKSGPSPKKSGRPASEAPAPARFSINPTEPGLLATLRRRAKASGQSVSRVAEQAILRGLGRERSVRPTTDEGTDTDPTTRVAANLASLTRVTERDLSFILELVAELSFDLFQRLPRSLFEDDPLLRQAAAADLDALLDRVAARHLRQRRQMRVGANTVGSLPTPTTHADPNTQERATPQSLPASTPFQAPAGPAPGPDPEAC